MTVVDAVARARAQLVEAGIPETEAGPDAEVLARHVLGWDRAAYLAHRRETPPPRFDDRYRPLVVRRSRREPVSLITTEREFWGRLFTVSPDVLTPRPETELVVDAALAGLGDRRDRPIAVADIGTGSGCLAVTLALELRRATVAAVDISGAALAVARRNAERHRVDDRICWVEAPFAEWLSRPGPDGSDRIRFDRILANLPYVPSAEIERLPPEVRLYEPRLALDGGVDGLDPLRHLLAHAPARLAPAGMLVVELGAGQADALARLVAATPGLALAEIRHDLQGIARVAVIEAAPASERRGAMGPNA